MIKDIHLADNKFYITKWYLDFISNDGEAFILYSAELYWHGYKFPYASILHYTPYIGISFESHLGKTHKQIKTGDTIVWSDDKFGINGIWTSKNSEIIERLFELDSRYLDWHCHQPSSEVILEVNGKKLTGSGYVENLIMTVYPWDIPMNELKWGRFIGGNNSIVWIEICHNNPRKWLWINGDSCNHFTVRDNLLVIKDKNIELHLDKLLTLESEKKFLMSCKR